MRQHQKTPSTMRGRDAVARSMESWSNRRGSRERNPTSCFPTIAQTLKINYSVVRKIKKHFYASITSWPNLLKNNYNNDGDKNSIDKKKS